MHFVKDTCGMLHTLVVTIRIYELGVVPRRSAMELSRYYHHVVDIEIYYLKENCRVLTQGMQASLNNFG